MAILAMSGMATLSGSARNIGCVMPILDLQTQLAENQNKKLKISTHNQFFTNNTSVPDLINYNNYFGTGIDGNVIVSSSAQISSSTSPAGLNNPAHGEIIVKNYKNLTINSGILFSPLRPCRGLLIYCTGNLNISGTISMTGKGGGVGNKIATSLAGLTSVTDARYDLVDASFYVNNMSSSAYRVGGKGIPFHWNWAPSGSVWLTNYKIRIPLSGSVAGGAGGNNVSPSAGTGGIPGSAGVGCCGGGGGGGVQGPFTGAGTAGGRGTIFCGGGGGAGNPTAVGGSLQPGSSWFEIGGGYPISPLSVGGGGAGNPGGYLATPGVGGLLILFVRGNVNIIGSITSNGSTGGAALAPNGGGGGGSGGGRIMIIYGGTYTNFGTITVTGGTGGTSAAAPGAYVGGNGGAGTTFIKKVHT